VLGLGQPWRGFQTKVVAIRNFCARLPSEDIVCFFDGFDTVLNVDAGTALTPLPRRRNGRFERCTITQEIRQKFQVMAKQTGAHLVFSRNDVPTSGLIGTAFAYSVPRVFGPSCGHVHGGGGVHLNSGMYVGYAGAIAKFWEGMEHDTEARADDQRFASYKCRRLRENEASVSYTVPVPAAFPKVHVDVDRELFFNMWYHPVEVIPAEGCRGARKLRFLVEGTWVVPSVVSRFGNFPFTHVPRTLGYNVTGGMTSRNRPLHVARRGAQYTFAF